MSLFIYESADPGTAFSVSGVFTNPFQVTVDGSTGDVIYRKYYVRNSDAAYYYTGITLYPTLSEGPDIVNGEELVGFTWKVKEGDQMPVEEEWSQLPAGNTISLSNLGSAGNPDTSTYLPFWVRVAVPRDTSVQSFANIQLAIAATQSNV